MIVSHRFTKTIVVDLNYTEPFCIFIIESGQVDNDLTYCVQMKVVKKRDLLDILGQENCTWKRRVYVIVH